MASRVLQRASFPVTNEQFTSLRAKLRKLGFGCMRELKGDALKKHVPPDFPAPGREVLTKAAGKSVARFVFNESGDIWNMELTLSRPMDMRGGLLIEAFPGKKHRIDGRTYEANLSPTLNEATAVTRIDDLNVFLAGIVDDREITEAVDAQLIKKRLQALGGQLEESNTMVDDFLNYMAGFVTHCDELWAWQVQRLKMDGHTKTIMSRIADKV